MSTFGQLRQWSAGDLSSAANGLRIERDRMSTAADEVRKGPSAWSGYAYEAQSMRRTMLLDDADAFIDDLNALSNRVAEAADQVSAVSRKVEGADSMARRHSFSISDIGVVQDIAPPATFPTQEDADLYTQERVRLRNEILTEVEDALRAANEVGIFLQSATASLSLSDRRDPDGRYGGREATDRATRRDEPGSSNFSNDWAGRAILERYLFGRGGRWDLDNDPTWSQYMMDNELLTENMRGRNEAEAAAAVRRYLSGGPSTSTFDDRFHVAIENGEGIVGYQYLHGTNELAGDFHHRGSTQVTPRGDGTFEVRMDVGYTWNDMIDPNLKYDTDRLKSKLAEILTFGRNEDYSIHITWDQSTTVIVDEQGRVISTEGWPG